MFFRKLIEGDLAIIEAYKTIEIADLGCGVGHGCYSLPEIPNSRIVPVDCSPESIGYARGRHAKYQLLSIFPEQISKRSQDLPEVFCPTGAVWWTKTDVLRQEKTFHI